MKNYFKKFSIMLFYVFLFLGVMGISDINKAFAEEYLITPTNMTDNSSPSPYKVSASSIDSRYKEDQPWRAFDNEKNSWLNAWFSDANVSNSWIAIDIATKKRASSYSFSTWNDDLSAAPKTWTFEGSNDGVNWIILDTRSGVADWSFLEEKKFYLLNVNELYSKFRINVTSNNGRIDTAIDNFKIYSDSLFDITTNISLNKSTDNLQVGQTDSLTATTTPSGAQVTWTSSDSSIATVDSTGKVTGIKEGQATIIVTTADGATAKCVVTVTNGTVPVEPKPTESEYIINTARAKGDNTNNASGQVSIIFKGIAEAQLGVVKTADVDSVYVGDNFTYTIVVTNTSTKLAKAVIIKDDAPNHINFIVNGITTTQGKVDQSSTAKNVIVNVGDIPPLGTVTIKIPSTVVM